MTEHFSQSKSTNSLNDRNEYQLILIKRESKFNVFHFVNAKAIDVYRYINTILFMREQDLKMCLMTSCDIL